MQPLADRMRPNSLDDYIGQEHLLGPDALFRKTVEQGQVGSMILWGPPGVGKTSLAGLIAKIQKRPFHELSAVHAGVKQVREVIGLANKQRFFDRPGPILFIDEIHRFSKNQQDALLGAVERGQVTLIGATTENPSFEVISALLSRCQLHTLKPLSPEHVKLMLDRALNKDVVLSRLDVRLSAYDAMSAWAAGDGRKAYNLLEVLTASMVVGQAYTIDEAYLKKHLPDYAIRYDKNGEEHYNIISAFIKSIRGSDPNASIYWLARMIRGGEEVSFIARRLIILASEDIGLANPNALVIAQSTFDAVRQVGHPESRIILSQCTLYLANSPKSNTAYKAIEEALNDVDALGPLPVPIHLRNASTSLMRDAGYGQSYIYPHDHNDHYTSQAYMPNDLQTRGYYKPGDNTRERQICQQLQSRWPSIYNTDNHTE